MFTVSMFNEAKDNKVQESDPIDFKGLREALDSALKNAGCGSECIGSKCEAKATHGAWSGVKYKNGKRDKDNVVEVYVAAYDVDKKTEAELETIVEKLEASGYSAIIHSTHNDLRDGIRAVRVILELSRPVKPSEWLSLWQGIQDELELKPEQCAKDTSRIFFLPTYPGPEMPNGFIPPHIFEGKTVDVDKMLKTVKVSTKTVPTSVQVEVPDVELPDVAFDIGKLREELGAVSSSKLARLRKAILKGDPLRPEDGEYTSREPMLTGIAMCLANVKSRWTTEQLLELVKPSMTATDFSDKAGAGYEERMEKLATQIDSALAKRDVKTAADLATQTETQRLKDSLLSIARAGAKKELSKSEIEDLENWEQALDVWDPQDAKTFKPSIYNMILILTFCEDWIGKLRLNEATDKVTMVDPPRRFDASPDYTVSALRTWFALSKWHFEPRASDTEDALRAVGASNRYNPTKDQIQEFVRDYNDEKVLDTWLYSYCGVSRLSRDGSDISKYVSAVGRKFIIGMIARLYTPGCKMDTVLVLEGKQGCRKSTAVEILSLGNFTDTPQPLGEKDSYMAYKGAWVVEQAELLSIKKAQTEMLKAVITSTHDNYRGSYMSETISKPRGYVFVGTTNETEYLRDATGSRRFWPITCGEIIDTDGLKEAMPSIMAEAFLAFQAGEKWHLTPEEEEVAMAENRLRFVSSGTDEHLFALYLAQPRPRPDFVAPDNFAIWSGLKPGPQYALFRQEVGRALTSLEWKKVKRRLPGRGQVQGYLVPTDLRDAPANDSVIEFAMSKNKGLL